MNMDYKNIEQLLEKYWQCETSIEEESLLRQFFTQGDVPAHLLRYKSLFVYQQIQRNVGLSKDFDTRILAEVEPPVVKARRLTLTARFMPLFKAAAVVVLFLSLGNIAQHSFTGEDRGILAVDTIGRQVTTPSVAISNDSKTESVLVDSLAKINKGLIIKE
ncbi:hypothetical protein IX321_000622 [Bacteroides pyogenes]|nr:hypothetical protein [Bacteroides pyogenes]MBR8756485.1 hypothetical protein [Bacteroides pyogenes]MBR8779776.1 hypothetical protein [Bacteroides pyogenes]GAE17569.1 hypothetical protein JCM6294_336 [Bacteroides pyogenes DSM 20611 = JCM 6294]